MIHAAGRHPFASHRFCSPMQLVFLTISLRKKCAKLAVHSAARFCARKFMPSTASMSRIGLTAHRSATTRLRLFSRRGPISMRAFFAHPRETVDFHYERKLFQVLGSTSGGSDESSCRRGERRRSPGYACPHAGGRSLRQRASIRGSSLRSSLSRPGSHFRRSTTANNIVEHFYPELVHQPNIGRRPTALPLPAQSSTYELIQVQPMPRSRRHKSFRLRRTGNQGAGRQRRGARYRLRKSQSNWP